jgi:hypothetical protein
VVTTINGPGHSGIRKLIDLSRDQNYILILVGDEKTPNFSDDLSENLIFLSVARQMQLEFESTKIFPFHHYARKNIGYLLAAQRGVTWLAETDDDNFCYSSFWTLPQFPLKLISPLKSRFLNTFSVMGHSELWPRGIPLTEVRSSSLFAQLPQRESGIVACIQGLTDREPDVDAVARSLFETKADFSEDAFLVANGSYVPSNSQMTMWRLPDTLALLYIPFSVSWRVADIWRGYIAQRFFHLKEQEVVVRGGVGSQDRNCHDLRVDFFEEVEVHTKTHLLVDILDQITDQDAVSFMRQTYTALIAQCLFHPREANYLEAWLQDVQSLSQEF